MDKINTSIRPNTEYSAKMAEWAEYQKLRENGRKMREKKYQIPWIFPSNQVQINRSSCSIQFDEFSVRWKKNKVAFFNYTNFSVKSDANQVQVAVFNFTKFSVKSNINEVSCKIQLFHEFSRQIRCKSSYRIPFHEIFCQSK